VFRRLFGLLPIAGKKPAETPSVTSGVRADRYGFGFGGVGV